MPPDRTGPKHMGPLQPAVMSSRKPYGRPIVADPDDDPARRPATDEEIAHMATMRIGGHREPDEWPERGWAA